MVRSSYRPTNKRFRDSFQKFAGTKTKKGNLNNEDDKGSILDKGTLTKIKKSQITGKGWYVDVSGKQYVCTYNDYNGILPEVTETKEFYYPRNTPEVDVTINNKEKTYNIERIKNLKTNISTSTNGSVTIENNLTNNSFKEVNISSDNNSIQVNNDNVALNGTITINNQTFDTIINGVNQNVENLNNDINKTLIDRATQFNDLIDYLAEQYDNDKLKQYKIEDRLWHKMIISNIIMGKV